ncbi:MAG: DNA methyltransferase [Thermomicrobiales bacterium]
MLPAEFQQKWIVNATKERTASQEHFIDLCRVLGQPTPAESDPDGSFYTFERGAAKTGGGQGWADVWKRGYFAWEYKGKDGNLDKAYEQLLRYKDDLENPPLLVVCDLNRFLIHTNFTNTVKRVYEIDLATFAEPESLRILRAVFTDPDALRPTQTVAAVTEEAARRFGQVAIGLHARGHAPHDVAHFLMQLLFCLFAEDVSLLPNKVFARILAFGQQHPDQFTAQVRDLLTAMASGGTVNLETIPYFNGGLFATVNPLDLTPDEIRTLTEASRLDWSSVEPAIFGTLFERSLDPAKRSQLGAHYTGRTDIERVIDPVIMVPLRRRWDAVRAELDTSKAAWDAAKTAQTRTNRRNDYLKVYRAFREELATVSVLDPACGSGNFLYVALERLLTLEKEVLTYGANQGIVAFGFPQVRPTQVMGLEVNEYAQQLAQVVIWIGYLQWMLGNGFGYAEPILEALDSIRLQDSLLAFLDDGTVTEAIWPAAQYIVGNPPFLGGNKIRQELGDAYVTALFAVYDDRIPQFSDLCCYFFEKAREEIASGHARRAGLLATNSIRGGVNRKVLQRIKETGDIYMAWSDEPWILDGAAVRISIVGFDDGSETVKTLDGNNILAISSSLNASRIDITSAVRLSENAHIGFQGDTKGGPFEMSPDVAEDMLRAPANPNGRPNSDVVRPWRNGLDIVRRSQNRWIVDFGTSMPESEASLFELPFEYVERLVKPARRGNRVERTAERWWIHRRPVPPLRRAISKLNARYLVTPRLAKHRVFAWLSVDVLSDSQLFAFAREDDYFFGVLHSRAHEVWSLRMGTSLEDRPRYTPTTCFETFPLPWPPGAEPVDDPRVQAIAAAAERLNTLREAWLNPPDASEAELKKRTLTNLYNARPTWLANAHTALDAAVWAAYGWTDAPAETTDEQILERILALNLERAATNRGD